MKKFFVVSCLLMFTVCSSVMAASESEKPSPKLKIQTLAVFKNGLGFVYRSGKTEVKDGWTVLDAIPDACLGTLWIGTTEPNSRVEEVVSSKETTKKEYLPTDISDLLDLNLGKKLVLVYRGDVTGGTQTITGTLLNVPSGPAKPDTPYRYNYSSYAGPQTSTKSTLILIQTDDKKIQAINRMNIISVELPEDAVTTATTETQTNAAKARVSGKESSAEMTMAYLQKGFVWSPSYLVNIKDDKLADISMEAILANDVEDLNDVDLSFAVGYPNFMFSNRVSLLSLGQDVRSFVNDLSIPLSQSGSDDSSRVMSQSIAYNTANYYAENHTTNLEMSYSTTIPMEGETNEDLYFYHQNHVTLKKGERARYQVFTGKIPYEHLYQWNVVDSMNINDYGHSDRQDPSKLQDQVWHVIRMENTTKLPWTTAPAFVVNGANPVSQDVLNYTPFGGKNTLRLTVATDVRAEQDQKEISRKQATLMYYSNYDEVQVQGTLTIHNFKQKVIRCNVKKPLTGEVLNCDNAGKITKTAKRLSAVNPQSEIEWEFDLPGGSEKVLKYQYKVYVAR